MLETVELIILITAMGFRNLTNLRQLGPMNLIINNSDSKLSEFENSNLLDSKSDYEFGLRLKDDDKIQLISIIF